MKENQSDRPKINKFIHPPIVALVYLAIALLLGPIINLQLAVPRLLQYAGFLLIVTGFLIGAAASREFRKAKTTLDPHGSVSSVVRSGIYRFTRNPIYLGFLLMVIGFPLNAGEYWGIIVTPFFISTMNRLIIEKEEDYLETKFGETYTTYKSETKRWLW